MTGFSWNLDADDAGTAVPESGFEQLGFSNPTVDSRVTARTAAPEHPGRVAESGPAQPVLRSRRELRKERQGSSGLEGFGLASPAEQSPMSQSPAAQSPAPQISAVQLPVTGDGPRRSRRAAETDHTSSRARPRSQSRKRKTSAVASSRRPKAAPPRQPAQRPAGTKTFKRRLISKLMTMGAMVGAGLMMVSTSLPANAFYPNDAALVAPTTAQVVQAQSLTVLDATTPELQRDGYTAVSLREQIYLKYGNRSFAYTNNPNGTIQWPFPIAVPISDGYGYRVSPCSGCSSDHKGVDFTPGAGTAIQAIADGVVSYVEVSSWGLGNHVIVDHHIDGHLVQSVYAHMAYGSIRVAVGQQLHVTDIIGLVGNTGASTGAHLHLEIHVDGVPVDPFAWLKANAN